MGVDQRQQFLLAPAYLAVAHDRCKLCLESNPGAMHAVNVLLHLATAILLFFTLSQAHERSHKEYDCRHSVCDSSFTRRIGRMDRGEKRCVCGLLIVLSLWCYRALCPGPSRKNYAVVLLVFGLACMAKPMAVIIPVLMLTLDYWPLKRIAMREKLPFFAIAAVLAWVTYIGQKAAGALDMAGPLRGPHGLRNAIYSLGHYVIGTFLYSNESCHCLSIPRSGSACTSDGDPADPHLWHRRYGSGQAALGC